MKPVKINLVLKKDFWGKLSLGLIAVLAFATCGLTLVNTYDYFANVTVVKTYEKRVKEINQRTERKRLENRKTGLSDKESKKLKQDLAFFSGLIEKNLHSLPKILSVIELSKPLKLNINSLDFLDGMSSVRIRGESDDVMAVTQFIIDLDKTGQFKVELSREEIRENIRIAFELIATWAGTGPGMDNGKEI